LSDAEALALLDRLLDLSDSERAEQLKKIAGEDAALHVRLQRLLAAALADDNSQILAQPIIEGLRAARQSATLTLEPEQTLAGYRLLRELGRGGMSVVWLAERVDGMVKRQIALKLPLFVLSTPLEIERFAREKDVLAALTHPNIARLYDAGVAPTGQPFIVLELVDGLPITTYCDRHQLGIHDRVRLFLQVLAAVDHAHKHLVVHRDLKPSNILVDAQGQVKLLDFGIAKLLTHPASSVAATQLTRDGSAALTPLYAAPEQVSEEPISTVTDVYVLGLVLHELVTGVLPYANVIGDLPSLAKIVDALMHGSPTRPSHAPINDDAAHRRAHANTRRLQSTLAGDLDAIVLTALRQEPQSRYASVNHFAEDLRRFLTREPVLARKGTASYLIGKFVARHKIVVAASLTVALTIIVGLLVTLRQARIAEANAVRAQQRFNDVRRLANSLVFEFDESIRQLPGATTARQLIIQRAQEFLEILSRESADDPLLMTEAATAYAKLASIQGNTQESNLGNAKSALDNYRQAVSLMEAAVTLRPNDSEIVQQLSLRYSQLAGALALVGETTEGERYLHKAVQIIEPLAKAHPDDLRVCHTLGKTYEQMAQFYREANQLDQSLEYFKRAHAAYLRLLQAEPDNEDFQQELAFSHKHIGGALFIQGALTEALNHYQAARKIDEAQLALDPANVIKQLNITFTYGDTALILLEQGNVDAALEYYTKVLAIRERLAAADQDNDRIRSSVARTLNDIGRCLEKKQDHSGATKSYQKALLIREALANKDPANLARQFDVADTQWRIGTTTAFMALQPGATRQHRLNYCRQSLAANRAALPIIERQKTEGRLLADKNALAFIKENIHLCEQAIAGNKSRADAS
jgi:non-specific serine/threonine protein kinase/serine/threonine-protein kinase